MLKDQLKALIETGPAEAVEKEIKDFVASSPANRMPSTGELVIFDEPLVRFADGDDPIFTEYKSIIAPMHLTPREALAGACDKKPEDLPERLSVISWILPITESTRKTNREEEKGPSRLWSHTRWYGEKFNDAVRNHLVDTLHELGYLAAAPPLQPYFKTEVNEKGPYSNWSERHVAYAAGQGTFSLTDGFITDRGMAHRCGNVVTDLVLPASQRKVEDHYSNCLFYFDGSCRACIDRCPGGAITEDGHDKKKCQQYMHDLGYRGGAKEYDDETSIAGCGLCQTKVPCEYGVPAKILKKRAE
ncbi:epoxyqueuosine reductase [Chloroflexota bacterium]